MRPRLIAIVGLALALAACGALPPSVFRSDRSDPLQTPPPLSDAAGGGLWIAPLSGAPAETDSFRAALQRALLDLEVPAGLDSAGPRGARLLAAVAPATYEGRGYVDVWWRLEGADGALWDAFSVPTPLDFRIERPETKDAIREIATRIGDQLGPPPPAVAAKQGPIPVAVLPAVGVGIEDGVPLSRAMAVALTRKGVLPGQMEPAVAIVKVQASIGPATGQPQNALVKIRWAVESLDGREIGAADQKNVLPREQLGQNLTGIAVDAAGAAVDAIAGLIRIAARNAAPSTAVNVPGGGG